MSDFWEAGETWLASGVDWSDSLGREDVVGDCEAGAEAHAGICMSYGLTLDSRAEADGVALVDSAPEGARGGTEEAAGVSEVAPSMAMKQVADCTGSYLVDEDGKCTVWLSAWSAGNSSG